MAEGLLSNVVVPVAGPDDADATCAAAIPYLRDAGGSLTAIYVVEKAGGAIDKASVEQREELAEEAFATVERACEEAGVAWDAEIRYGTDVIEAIVDGARERAASAIVFTPRPQSRWVDLVTGDLSDRLVTESDRPVVVFPRTGTGQ